MLQYHSVSAQEGNTIRFSYDAGGNLTERKLQVFVDGRTGTLPTAKDSIKTNALKVYPNPANTSLTISGKLPDHTKDADFCLLSINGQTLRSGNYNGDPKTIDVSGLENGIYFLTITISRKERNSYKIIVTH